MKTGVPPAFSPPSPGLPPMVIQRPPPLSFFCRNRFVGTINRS